MAAHRKPGADWNAIRRAYAQGTGPRELGRQFKLSHSTIIERAQKEGWDSSATTAGNLPESMPTTRPIADHMPFPGMQKKSPAMLERIVADFAEGHNRSVVCAQNAITLQTLRAWEAEDATFAARILHAQARFPAECVSTIREDVKRGNAQTAFSVLKSHPLTRDDFADRGHGGGITISLNIPLPGSIAPPNGYAQGAEPITIEHETEAA